MTCIFMVIFGQLVHWPTIPTPVLFPVVVLAYYGIARREERNVMARFGDRAYASQVLMLVRRRREWRRLIDATRATSRPE